MDVRESEEQEAFVVWYIMLDNSVAIEGVYSTREKALAGKREAKEAFPVGTRFYMEWHIVDSE